MDLDSPTPATTDTTSDTSMARGPLMPSLLLMLMLMLTMVPTATATLLWLMPLSCPPSMDSPTPATTDTSMARGPLMLSPLLMLMLTMLPTATLLWLLPLLCPPSTEGSSTDLLMAVSTATTMARGLLMPSPLLPLLLKLMPMPSTTTGMPTTDTVSTMATLDTMATPATTDIPTCTTATATSMENNLLILVC